MTILKGDVLDVGNGEVVVESLEYIENIGWYIKFKDISKLYALKNINADNYRKYLVRRS